MPKFLLNQRFFSVVIIIGLTSLMLVSYQNCGQAEFSRMGSDGANLTPCQGLHCGSPSAQIISQLTNGKNVFLNGNGSNTCAGLTAEDVQNGLHRTVTLNLTAINFMPTAHYCLRLSPIVDGPGAVSPAHTEAFDCGEPFTLDLGAQSQCHYQVINNSYATVRITCSNLPNSQGEGYRLEVRGQGTGENGIFLTNPANLVRFVVNDCTGAPSTTTTTSSTSSSTSTTTSSTTTTSVTLGSVTTTSVTTTTQSQPPPQHISIIGVGKPGIDDVYDHLLIYTNKNPAIRILNPYANIDTLLADYTFTVKIYNPRSGAIITQMCNESIQVKVAKTDYDILLQTKDCPAIGFPEANDYLLVVEAGPMTSSTPEDPFFKFDVKGPFIEGFQILGVSDDAEGSPGVLVSPDRKEYYIQYENPGQGVTKARIKITGPTNSPIMPILNPCPEIEVDVPKSAVVKSAIKCPNGLAVGMSYQAHVYAIVDEQSIKASNSPFAFSVRVPPTTTTTTSSTTTTTMFAPTTTTHTTSTTTTTTSSPTTTTMLAPTTTTHTTSTTTTTQACVGAYQQKVTITSYTANELYTVTQGYFARVSMGWNPVNGAASYTPSIRYPVMLGNGAVSCEGSPETHGNTTATNYTGDLDANTRMYQVCIKVSAYDSNGCGIGSMSSYKLINVTPYAP